MRNNESFLMFLAGLGTGAALMYFLDPDRGGRRRALLRDQAVALTNDAREAIDATTEDLSNRAYGLYAETRKAVTGSALPSNQETAAENAASFSREPESNANQPVTNPELSRSATQT